MNILILSWRDPKHPLNGGAEQVVHEHSKGWIKAGHSVTLFSSDFGGPKEETLDGVHIIRQGSQFIGVQIAAFFWYLFGRHKKFDLVIDSFHGIPLFTPFYVKAKKLALIQEVAKEVWFLNHLSWPLNWIIGFVGFITEPIIFLFYKNIPFMTGSASAKEDLIKMGINLKNINIVHHGVIVKIPNQIIKEKINTIIFLGALAKDKGIESAIEAFKILDKSGQFNFWVVGKGDPNYLAYLKEKTKMLKNKITFFGFVSQDKKFELLSKAHILVNPSVREGWGLVNIEANGVGTPVVAYKSSGLIDSVKDGISGILCQENSPQDLAANVMSLLQDQTLYEKLKKGAIFWSRQFSWENSRKQSNELIIKCAKK
ncbi:MAG: glycosyltransferase family 4 protein [Candidatus Daviesbacteria bacterium]|nr:MAG: glycosyltransferase family 4 protein [Candidatus Daviesbacteria bacterium]